MRGMNTILIVLLSEYDEQSVQSTYTLEVANKEVIRCHQKEIVSFLIKNPPAPHQ